MSVLAPAPNLTPAIATGTVPTAGVGGLLASLPVSPNPSGGSPAQHQHQNHRQRRPGTSSSSSSSSFSADRDGAASADQELLDSWHRSLLRRNSSASSHGHGHGHGVMSNASMMGTNTTAESRPVSPAHMLWNYSTSAGSRVGSSRPTSPDPMMVGTLPPLHERVCAINGDGEDEPGGTAASLLAQLQAHQAMQQACQLQSMTGALAAAAAAANANANANGVVPSVGSTATAVTGTGMPRLIRRVSGAARPFSSSMSASVSSSSSGSRSAAAAGAGGMRAGGEAVMTEGYTVGACGSLFVDDDKEKAGGGGGGGQRWHASRSRQGSSSGMTR
ncbi:unnamed protein product [Tilletia controversa]|uniref:Uncharacterized protein n=3 Tax=Tilletia TaxID=13289 RepID=A0A8X7SX61_9BASI|nr:hypothetical protein CF336_g7994 [Tilletia laevis]KAE8187265.1 hypothetical protein CF328_g6971 [Tilletia controversa]KAE8245176.1 hypothetical protein A4X03_0g7492 [Tilletia caries]KAE8186328.1 hypothetical protein CF335_g7471 [Tilletia laevis]KAE8247336.1 hypothetical protein A4X06_0g4528 [Tilletia controversa]